MNGLDQPVAACSRLVQFSLLMDGGYKRQKNVTFQNIYRYPMLVLTEAERIAILSGCVAIVLVVVLLMICCVCPCCLFYKLVHTKAKEDEEMKFFWSQFAGSYTDPDPPPPYEPSNKIPFFDLKSPLELGRRLTSTNSVSTVCCSDSESVTGIPLPLITDVDTPSTEIRGLTGEHGTVLITLQFKRVVGEDKKLFAQLRVDLKEAWDLPLRAYGGRCDPYIVLSLFDKNVNTKKQKKKSVTPLHRFITTVVKKSQHPVYNESFFFPLEQNRVKKSVLKIEAWDQDRYANDTVLGEVHFSLKDVTSFLLQEPSKEMDLHLKLEDSKMINGHLLLGLCYLPTAERMTVAVLKANNLKIVGDKGDINDFYVHAIAMYGGKVFERRKTSCRPSSSYPVFNEMLMFDVPFSKLDHIVLLLSVRSNTLNESKFIKGDRRGSTKDACIGKVVIGSYSRKSTLNHWNAMRSSPRRQVIQWHELR